MVVPKAGHNTPDLQYHQLLRRGRESNLESVGHGMYTAVRVDTTRVSRRADTTCLTWHDQHRLLLYYGYSLRYHADTALLSILAGGGGARFVGAGGGGGVIVVVTTPSNTYASA